MPTEYIVGMVIGLAMIIISIFGGITAWRRSHEIRTYKKMLILVDDVKQRANLILQENEQVLVPIFNSRPDRKEISESMNRLFNLQQSRGDFEEWKALFEVFLTQEKDGDVKDLFKDLLDVINELQKTLYGQYKKQGKNNKIADLKNFNKKYVVNELIARELESEPAPAYIDDLRRLVEGYLNYLRTLIGKIGTISGKLKGMLNEFSSVRNPESEPKRMPSVSDPVIIALLGLFGVIFTASSSYLGNNVGIIIRATQTAEARLSVIGPGTPSSTIISPTNTGTMAPIETSTSTTPNNTSTLAPTETLTRLPLTRTPKPEIIFQDEFLDNLNGWPITSNEITTQRIIGGKFQQTTICPISYQAYYCGSYLLVPTPIIKNFLLSLDVTLEKIEAGDDVAIGIQFRRTDSSLYNANFHLTGDYILQIIKDKKTDTLFDGNNSSVIKSGIGNTNTISVLAKDFKLSLFANGIELGTIDDGNLASSGQIYLVIYVSKGGTATINLDDILITKP